MIDLIRRALLLGLSLFLCSSFSNRQNHCKFDYSGIVVVNPFDAQDYTLVDGLQMFLIDKNGEPKRTLVRNRTPGDTIYFHRNPQQKKTTRIGKQEVHFPNAKNYYVQTMGKYSLKTYKYLRIIDTMKSRPGGNYGELTLTLRDSNLMDLCYNKPFWNVRQWVAQHIVRVPLIRP